MKQKRKKKIEKRTQGTNKQPSSPHQTLRWVIPKAVSIRRKTQSKGQCQGKGHTFHNCRDVKSLGEGNGNPTPWMEEPGREQSMGSQRIGHD